jgi:hypothetical protein
MQQMAQVAQEGKILAPLKDDLLLAESGLDSLGFAVLVQRGLDNGRALQELLQQAAPRYVKALKREFEFEKIDIEFQRREVRALG